MTEGAFSFTEKNQEYQALLLCPDSCDQLTSQKLFPITRMTLKGGSQCSIAVVTNKHLLTYLDVLKD